MLKIIFFFFFLLLMLVFTKSHSLLPRKSIYQRSYFFQTFTVMLHTVPFIFSCNTSLILMTFPKNNDNNLTMIRMKFSWRRMWIYQLNWKKHCLWGETENVSSSRFTDKISSKKNPLILIWSISSQLSWYIFLSERDYTEEITFKWKTFPTTTATPN